MVSGLLSLPDEILLVIYELVDYENLVGGLSQTCSRLHQLSKVNSLWTSICEPTYVNMRMKREHWKDIGNPRDFHYDQLKTRKAIYALLDDIVVGRSGSPTPTDDTYTAHRYSLVRKICDYKESAFPSLYAVANSNPVESQFSLCHQFYANSIIAVIVKQRALEVLENHGRFTGYCLLDFVMAVRDVCSDSVNYELLQSTDHNTLDYILEKVCDHLDVPTSQISTTSPLMIAEALNSFLRSVHYDKIFTNDFADRYGPLFALTGVAAFYTHFAQHLGLNACTLVFESWTCVLITEESGAVFIIDVERDCRVRSTSEVPFVRTLDRAKLDSVIATGAETIFRNLGVDVWSVPPRRGLEKALVGLYMLYGVFEDASRLQVPDAFAEIPLQVLVLETVFENPPEDVKKVMEKVLNAPGMAVRSRTDLVKEVTYRIGDLCSTVSGGRLGVIVGWDLQHPRYPQLPEVYYHWLSRNEELYVPQSDLTLSTMPISEQLCTAEHVADYDKLGEYFMRFDESCVQPTRELRYAYPDDRQ